jgi:phosphoglycolate phosphatase-like HAD superfamily hydrolase
MGAFGDDHEDRNELAKIAQKRASRMLGRSIASEEILIVGDTPLDIACARSISARVLAVATGGFTAAQLRTHAPSRLVENLEQIRVSEMCR